MEFKKIDTNSFQIKAKTSAAKLIVSVNDQGFLQVKSIDGDKIVTLDRPGEYGVSNFHFVLNEDGGTEFKGKPNVMSISDMLVINIIVFGNNFDVTKAALDRMPDANVIITPLSNDAALKAILKKMQPNFVIFLKDFAGVSIDEKNQKALEGDIPFLQNEDSKVKLEESDFEGEEDVITQAYVL